MAGDCETIRREKTFFSVKMCRMDKGAKMLQSGEVQRNWTLNVGLHSGVHKGLESRVFRKREERLLQWKVALLTGVFPFDVG